MYSDCLEIIFELDKITALEMWGILIDQKDIIGDKVDFIDKTVATCKVESLIREENNVHFGVSNDVVDISFGPVGRYKHIFFKIRSKEKRTPDDWKKLLELIYMIFPFIQARISNCEYNYWQNAHDIIQYNSHDRSYAGLPMKSNGLPPPLEQMIIDTSKNPGRRILKDGYVEFVSSHMWITEYFLDNISNNKEEKISKLKDNFNVTMNNGLLYLELSKDLYTEENNNPESLNKLRDIIYYL